MRYLLFLVMLSCSSCSVQHYYVVRHAEKQPVPAGADSMQASDPPLSAAGEQRALDLASTLKNKKITRIYSTNFKRTFFTALPMSKAHHLAIERYSPSADSLSDLITALAQGKNGNILIVGHSNTIDDIANALAKEKVVPGDLDDYEYDNIFIITRQGKKRSFKRIKFGKTSVKP